MARLVDIYWFLDPEEAICVRSLLNAHGVEVWIPEEFHMTSAPALRLALGGYRIVVLDAQAADATAIMRASIETTFEEASEPAQRPPRNWTWIPIALLWSVPFLPRLHGAIQFSLQTATGVLLLASLAIPWTSWLAG